MLWRILVTRLNNERTSAAGRSGPCDGRLGFSRVGRRACLDRPRIAGAGDRPLEQSARQSRGPRLRGRHRRPHRSRVPGGRPARRPLAVPCRGGLSLLGARSFGHPARECRGHAQPDGRSAVGRRGADRLYQQRRRAEDRRCDKPRRRDLAALAGRGHRRLQAQQDPGGACRRGNDRARQAARHHRQSDDADRADGTSSRRRPAASCSMRRAAGFRPSSIRD